MPDYQSRYSGPQIDNMLAAVNESMTIPGSSTVSTLVGYRYVGLAIPSTTPEETNAKIYYIAQRAGTYTNFDNLVVNPGETVILRKNVSDNWIKEPFSESDTFYVTCDTAGTTQGKSISIPALQVSTRMRLVVKMIHANTADNVTLSINNGISAPLYYRGARASSTNTWDDNEVLDIYYDGTNYQAIANVAIVQTTGQNTKSVMSQKAVTDELDSIKATVYPVTAGLTSNIAKLQEYTGTDIALTLTWSCKRRGVAKIPSQVVLKKDNNIIETITSPSAATGTKSTTINLLGTTTFTAIVTADNIEAQASLSLKQVLPCYVGFYATGATVNAMKGSLTKKLVDSVTSLSGTYTNQVSGNSLIICVPSSMTITKVKSSGFDVPMNEPVIDTSVIINGVAQEYKIYRSASATGINAGNMTITVE